MTPSLRGRTALMRSGDTVFLDQYSHASIVDGAILAKSKTVFFRHNNPMDLERKMARVKGKKLVVVPILRAGLGMVEGVWELMPSAEVWHIGLYRDERTLKPVEYYNKLPTDPTVQLCLILDPMLATGKTLENVLAALKAHGEPTQIHILSVIGSKRGIAHVKSVFPESTHLWISAVDDTLSAQGYIIPGLGDAGDLAFGMKL